MHFIQSSRRNHLFDGMPIEFVRRRMIIIIGIIVSEAKDPTRNVILNAAVSGIVCYDRPYK